MYSDNNLTTNQLVGRKVLLVAKNNVSVSIPQVNWTITSNTGDTLTVTGPDCTTVLDPLDVVIVTSQATSSGTNYIEDNNWVNAFNDLNNNVGVLEATNATPIVVTTSVPHGRSNGDRVYIQGVAGNTAANGVRYVSVVNATDLQLYSDTALTVPVAGSGVFVAGNGSLYKQEIGLYQDLTGLELYCAFGKGAGISYTISSNTSKRITIEGTWEITPDSTSVWMVLEPQWFPVQRAPELNNSDPNRLVTLTAPMLNFRDKLLFTQVFTEDGAESESWKSLSPWRLVYLYGQAERRVAVSTNYVASIFDDIIEVNIASNSLTVWLPSSGQVNAKRYLIKVTQQSGSYTCTVRALNDNIEGSPTFALNTVGQVLEVYAVA